MPNNRAEEDWNLTRSESSIEEECSNKNYTSKKNIRYKKIKTKKMKKTINAIVEKMEKPWREKLHSKIKEDSETIRKMFELLDEEENQNLKHYGEIDIDDDDVDINKFKTEEDNNSESCSYEDLEEEEMVNLFADDRRSNYSIKEIESSEVIGDWNVILSTEEQDGITNPTSNNTSCEKIELRENSETIEEEDEKEQYELAQEEHEDFSEETRILEDCDGAVEDEEEEEEEEVEKKDDNEKNAELEQRMILLSETLARLKAELEEAKRAVEEEKKSIILPGHVCTIAEPCSVAAQLEERLRARREVAAANYREGLQQVERMVSQEILRLEEDMNKLQPLNKIASDWELSQELKPKSIMYRHDYMLITDMNLNIPKELKTFLKAEINEVS